MDEIMKGVKIGKLLGKDEKKETCKVIAIVVGVIATIAAIAGAAYAIYRFVNRDDMMISKTILMIFSMKMMKTKMTLKTSV